MHSFLLLDEAGNVSFYRGPENALAFQEVANVPAAHPLITSSKAFGIKTRPALPRITIRSQWPMRQRGGVGLMHHVHS